MDTQPNLVTAVFALLLVCSVLLRLWLISRQVRHVRKHREQVPAAFAGRVTPEQHRHAADYTVARNRLALVRLALGTVVLLGWTLLGGLQALDNAVAPRTLSALGPMGYQLALIAAFVVIDGLIDAPLDAWSRFRIDQRFGFNRMRLRDWLVDGLKSAIVGAVIGLPLAAAVLWLAAHGGGLWWLWVWAVWIAFMLAMMVLGPTVIAPLFNKFEPLPEGPLRTEVESLLTRCGFASRGLYVMDGSRRSSHANAYFTGLGRAKRVVFFDTLLSSLTPAQILAVLAHELGHYHHRHVTRRLVTMAAVSLLAMALVGWASTRTAFFVGLGVSPSMLAPTTALALILAALVAPLGSFLIAPLMAHRSRLDEFQADAYAAAHADGGALAAALVGLHADNASTLTPDPQYVCFHYSHPPAAQRLARLPAPTVSPGAAAAASGALSAGAAASFGMGAAAGSAA